MSDYEKHEFEKHPNMPECESHNCSDCGISHKTYKYYPCDIHIANIATSLKKLKLEGAHENEND